MHVDCGRYKAVLAHRTYLEASEGSISRNGSRFGTLVGQNNLQERGFGPVGLNTVGIGYGDLVHMPHHRKGAGTRAQSTGTMLDRERAFLEMTTPVQERKEKETPRCPFLCSKEELEGEKGKQDEEEQEEEKKKKKWKRSATLDAREEEDVARVVHRFNLSATTCTLVRILHLGSKCQAVRGGGSRIAHFGIDAGKELLEHNVAASHIIHVEHHIHMIMIMMHDAAVWARVRAAERLSVGMYTRVRQQVVQALHRVR